MKLKLPAHKNPRGLSGLVGSGGRHSGPAWASLVERMPAARPGRRGGSEK